MAVKDIAYLGSDSALLESKLESLNKYKGEIRKAYRNIKKFIQEEYYLKKAAKLKFKEDAYIDRETLLNIEALRLHFNDHFMVMGKKIVDETYKNFLIDFAFNTTSLEGNTITLNEADKLLREKLAPKNRTLREIYDFQNTEEVFFNIISANRKVGNDLIMELHDKLMDKIDERKGYRLHDIRVFKSRFEATPFPYIKADMEILIRWYEKNKVKLHPLALAGIFHQKFEKIHPFSDGNGRTGRMLLSYMLLKNGYPPLIIRKLTRGEYLEAMALGDMAALENCEPKNYKRLLKYLAQELISGYWNNFNV